MKAQCEKAQKTMETPLSVLHLSITILRFIKSIDENTDDISQMVIFDMLKNDAQAKTRDLSFVYGLCERAIAMRDDDDCSEDALRAIDYDE